MAEGCNVQIYARLIGATGESLGMTTQRAVWKSDRPPLVSSRTYENHIRLTKNVNSCILHTLNLTEYRHCSPMRATKNHDNKMKIPLLDAVKDYTIL